MADWIEVCKEHLTTSLYTAMNPNFMKENNQSFDLILWIKKSSNQETFARAWLDVYEVEDFDKDGNGRVYFSLASSSCFTKKQLEDADFGWVFDCPGIEIEEVE